MTENHGNAELTYLANEPHAVDQRAENARKLIEAVMDTANRDHTGNAPAALIKEITGLDTPAFLNAILAHHQANHVRLIDEGGDRYHSYQLNFFEFTHISCLI
jgi:hypothetical protein